MRCSTRQIRPCLDRLSEAGCFAGCPPRELWAIASICSEIDVPAGRVLTQQGARGRECFVVLAGHAVVERDGVILAHVLAGSIIGEMALLGDGVRTATVTAATDMTLIVMRRTDLVTLRALGGAPTVWDQVYVIAADRRAVLDKIATDAAP